MLYNQLSFLFFFPKKKRMTEIKRRKNEKGDTMT